MALAEDDYFHFLSSDVDDAVMCDIVYNYQGTNLTTNEYQAYQECIKMNFVKLKETNRMAKFCEYLQ